MIWPLSLTAMLTGSIASTRVTTRVPISEATIPRAEKISTGPTSTTLR